MVLFNAPYYTWGWAGNASVSPGLLKMDTAHNEIEIHQTAYGLLLVSAFSFGLAVVLIAIGLTIVYAHKQLSNLPSIEPLQRFAPVVSAIAIIVAGTVLTVCAVI